MAELQSSLAGFNAGRKAAGLSGCGPDQGRGLRPALQISRADGLAADAGAGGAGDAFEATA